MNVIIAPAGGNGLLEARQGLVTITQQQRIPGEHVQIAASVQEAEALPLRELLIHALEN